MAKLQNFPWPGNVRQLAMIQTGGNVSQSAKLLGMSRDTLHTKLKKKDFDRGTILSESV